MEAPRIPKIFFRNLKSEPRRFNFKPRYYDQKKENWEKRKAELEEEVKREAEGKPVGRFNWSDKNSRTFYKQGVFSANIRLIVILILLCIVVWGMIKRLEILAN